MREVRGAEGQERDREEGSEKEGGWGREGRGEPREERGQKNEGGWGREERRETRRKGDKERGIGQRV